MAGQTAGIMMSGLGGEMDSDGGRGGGDGQKQKADTGSD